MREICDIDIQFVKGVGEKRGKVLREHGIETLEDLLYLLPRRYLDRTTVKPIRDLREGDEATIVGKVLSQQVQRGRKERFIALVGDGSGFIQCVWFHSIKIWKQVFVPGETFAFYGKVGYFNGLQMVHPEYDRIGEGGEWQNINTGAIIPLYPSSEKLGKVGLDSRGLRRLLRKVLPQYGELIHEVLPEDILRRQHLMPLQQALQDVHAPEKMESLKRARTRLIFDEFFYFQLTLALRRHYYRTLAKSVPFGDVGERTRKLIDKLPFELTNAQKRVLREIWADLKRDVPMNRLLQGDVGSGKTMVAVISMLLAIENGYQAAMMAPTEILAEQHYLTIHGFLEQLGLKVDLLVGRLKVKERRAILARIKEGETQVVIGTHALIQPDVEFQRLGLVVIDEQHRFGVLQRQALLQKGTMPHVLVMTATPIPRTLSMTLYGDLDVSVLDELPAGRKPIRTVWRSSVKRRSVYEFVRDELVQGAQAYIVFPLVEESEKVDLRAATETYEKVKDGFFREFEVGLLHGRMTSEEKEGVMQRFKAGEMQLLVATTVIEVGVDVPNATIMVIEHAERFGLTQLHQLRGRVGRGEKPSICILIAETPLAPESRRRIQTMCETTDGFKIAEVDLELRGPGEYFGTRQHGMPEFKVANLVAHGPILEKARREAFKLAEDHSRLNATLEKAQRFKFFRRFQENLDLAQIG